jgi:hypothetical protein
MAASTAPRGARGETIRNHATFIWSVADLLRGDYKQSEYGKVILALAVIRRPASFFNTNPLTGCSARLSKIRKGHQEW